MRTALLTLGAALTSALAVTPLGALVAPPLAAQATESTADNFDWDGTVASGRWLNVRNLNGSIDVRASTDGKVHVHGEKKWRHGDPKSVRYAVRTDNGDVTVCALWDPDERCGERNGHQGHHWDHDDDNDVSVKFTVQLPAGVKVDAGTVNGSVTVRDTKSEAQVATVNGEVDVSTTTGPVEAETVNGSVRVHMDKVPGDGDMKFSTVNGGVVVEIPQSLDADVALQTTNGRIVTDFPLTIKGRFDPRELRATLGKGGRRLELETVNGDVELRTAGK